MPLLFSYGTLRQEDVQLSTFGGRLKGKHDEPLGFEAAQAAIEDPQLAATTGCTHCDNARFNGNSGSRVAGMAFEITDAEFAAADQ